MGCLRFFLPLCGDVRECRRQNIAARGLASRVQAVSALVRFFLLLSSAASSGTHSHSLLTWYPLSDAELCYYIFQEDFGFLRFISANKDPWIASLPVVVIGAALDSATRDA